MSRRRRSSARRRTRQTGPDQPRAGSPAPANGADQASSSSSGSASAQWVVAIDGKPSEPLTAAGLKQMVEAGEITPDTPIRKVGMEKFVLARKVKGLLPTPADLPPTSPEAAATAPSDPAGAQPAEGLPPSAPSAAAQDAGPEADHDSEPATPVPVDVWDTLDTEELPDIRGA